MISINDSQAELKITPELNIESYKPEGLEERQAEAFRKLFKPRDSEVSDSDK